MPDEKVTHLPLQLEKVEILQKGEIITQIAIFNVDSLAYLTSTGRILISGVELGQWVAFPQSCEE